MILLFENTQKSYFRTKPSANSGVATCVMGPPFSYRDITIAGAKVTSKGSLFEGQFLDFIELSALLLQNARETDTTASF